VKSLPLSDPLNRKAPSDYVDKRDSINTPRSRAGSAFHKANHVE